jgi:tRNA(Arg) A34 adenosine deaminase TadA
VVDEGRLTQTLLRPATPADAEFVFSLQAAGDAAVRRQAFMDRFRASRFRVIVANGADVGTCRIDWQEYRLVLGRIDLTPELRGQGVEADVVRILQEEARRKSCAMRIAGPGDEAFRRLCERCGFAALEVTANRVVMADCSQEDERWMREALAEARMAAQENESPVGAVIVREDRIVGRGRNAPLRLGDPTLHAEMEAIRDAARAMKDPRLEGCALYVTVEPCAMCAGAIILSRIDRVVFGAPNEKFGACGSQCDLLSMETWNHRVAWRGGVLADESAALLRDFFQQRRANHGSNAV